MPKPNDASPDGGPPVPYRNLSAEEQRGLDTEGLSRQFSREEVRAAYRMIGSAQEAEQFVRLAFDDPRLRGRAGVFLHGEILDALSLLSDSTAEKVRVTLNLSPEAAQARRDEFRRRLARGGG